MPTSHAAADADRVVDVRHIGNFNPPPTIDPTVLTTQQITAATVVLKELFQAKFEELSTTNSLMNQVLETRLAGMDKAIDLLQAETNRLPARIDEKIAAIASIHEEKFLSVQTQFRERDVRTEQSSKDSKVAVDAALQAAKEAVGEQNKSSALAIAKSEASTVKQIDQMGLLIQTGNKAVDDKFDDIKERLTRIEGKNQGVKENVEISTNNNTLMVLGLGVVVSIVIGIAAIIVPIAMHH
jgi:hypothetical protein